MTRKLLATAIALAIAPPLHAQATCSPASLAAKAAAVAKTHLTLRALKVEEMSTDVSPAEQAGTASLKAALANATDAVLACSAPNASPADVQQHLATLLKANAAEPQAGTVIPREDPTDNEAQSDVYGSNLQIAVTHPASSPRVLAIQISFNIECGTDTMLLLYSPTDPGWKRTLLWQAEPYKQISGAFGGFFLYDVLPQSPGIPMRVLVAHGTDWCTSRWSGYKTDLLEAGSDASRPRVVWHKADGFVIESDPRLIPKPDGFELRLDVGTIESNIMVRHGVFRYQLAGDTVERVQPIAVDGRGFVDAWLQAPWSDARRWSAPEALPALEAAHAEFTLQRAKKEWTVTYSYGPVLACASHGLYQVEIDQSPGAPSFYSIEEGKNAYAMVGVSSVKDPRCTGPNLMKP